jgi:hypothetical protein
MNNRNIAIGVGVVILLLWLSRKKKPSQNGEVVGGGEDTTSGGGIGGGGGGGFFPSFPVPPIDVTVNTGDTVIPKGTDTATSGSEAKGDVESTRDSREAVPQDAVLQQTFTYRKGVAMRDFTIKTTTGATLSVKKGQSLDVAEPVRGSNTTHPKLNPKQTLLLGTDVDYVSNPYLDTPTDFDKDNTAVPTGGGSQTLNAGTSSGGSTTGGTTTSGTNPYLNTPTGFGTGTVAPTGGGTQTLNAGTSTGTSVTNPYLNTPTGFGTGTVAPTGGGTQTLNAGTTTTTSGSTGTNLTIGTTSTSGTSATSGTVGGLFTVK